MGKRSREKYNGGLKRVNYKVVKRAFLDFIFSKKPFTLLKSTHVEGNYDPNRRRLGQLRFDIVIRLDQHYKSEYVSTVLSNKKRLLKVAKKVGRSWTISEPTTFLTEHGQVDGLLVTAVTGENLLDFWIDGGVVKLKLVCYGIGT